MQVHGYSRTVFGMSVFVFVLGRRRASEQAASVTKTREVVNERIYISH